MQYLFPCEFTPDEEEGEGFVVTFPDVRGATCGAKTFKESIILAEDCLVVMLGAYIDCQEELPIPSLWKEGQELLTVQPLIAAQLDLYTAMRDKDLSVDDLAQRLKITVSEVQKLLVLDYKTSINEVFKALEALDSEASVGETVA
jgi:antitoxin HicB